MRPPGSYIYIIVLSLSHEQWYLRSRVTGGVPPPVFSSAFIFVASASRPSHETPMPLLCVACSGPPVSLPTFPRFSAGKGGTPSVHPPHRFTPPSSVCPPALYRIGVARGCSRHPLTSFRPRGPLRPGTPSPLAAIVSLSLSAASFRVSISSQNCEKSAHFSLLSTISLAICSSERSPSPIRRRNSSLCLLHAGHPKVHRVLRRVQIRRTVVTPRIRLSSYPIQVLTVTG